MELLVAMAIPAIGKGRPVVLSKFHNASAFELKGAVSRVVEVEWAKFTCFVFLSKIGPGDSGRRE